MKRVYLDYAATTPVRPEAVAAMAPYWTEKFGNPSSIHQFGREARQAVEEARKKIADLVGALSEEIVFTGTTTTSDNLAILGVARAIQESGIRNQESVKKERPHLITTKIEHHGVLGTFKHLEREGFEVTYLSVDKFGVVNLSELEKAIKPETVLVSVMYANNEVGTIEPILEISQMLNIKCQKYGNKIYFHTDAAAVVEYLDLNVNKLGVDLMTLGSHKFGGPKGVGILYVRKGTPMQPLAYGGHHESGRYPGTEAVSLIVGMGKALELAVRDQGLGIKDNESVSSRVTRLRDRLIKGVLDKVPETISTGHPTERLPDIASFCFDGAEGEAVLLRLDAEGIAVSSGSACTAGDLQPSHVLLAMGIPAEVAHGSIRFSLGRETTEEDIDYVLEKVPPIVAQIREMAPKF